MRFAFYCGVLLVALAGVVFGLDWVSAPMPPMPEAKNVVFVPPPPPPAPQPASPPPPGPAAAPASVPTAPAVPAPSPVTAAPKPACDVDACAAAYRSFRESDCTYNPSSGPRRLCTKGDPAKYARGAPAVAAPPPPPPEAPPAPAAPVAEQPGTIIAPEPGTTAGQETDAPAAPRCNVSACAAAYRSFRESDCTFNPSVGPRRVCEK